MPPSTRSPHDKTTTRSASAPPRTYSTAYVAQRLGISIPTVQRWVDAGRLKAWKTPGGHRRIDAASADRLFETQAAPVEADIEPVPNGAESLSVVIVEDNAEESGILRELVGAALPQAQVKVFDSGIQALVAIGQHAPDVFVTDIVMPHMNGAEMLRQLSTQCVVRPRLIVAVSSFGEKRLAELGELPPQVHFVGKPVDREPFIALLRGMQ
ncbi:response regulator [Piscinibacter gummiphilus]|uniref:Response regulator n=1 Tax=Piscinibacter gummiphilus TaxID=946333 RepID=A0ABZ0CT32_9BURK|nr:response regulator [Piscinibacter gummiphilus]WOB08124.1 response regulator [Piscinibacter gummiphilus]